MELYQLRTFIVVAEEGNVTRAAARLGLTPPSVSAQIKHLEEELHVQLFVRTARHVPDGSWEPLTYQGRAHSPGGGCHGREAARLQARLVGQVSFGLNATPEVLRVGAIAVHLQSTSPGITLQLVASGSGKIVEAAYGSTGYRLCLWSHHRYRPHRPACGRGGTGGRCPHAMGAASRPGRMGRDRHPAVALCRSLLPVSRHG